MKIIERFATKCPCWGTNLTQQGLSPSAPNADSRYQQYYKLFKAKKIKLMLHSLGCARASADVQASKWDSATNSSAIAHAVIDSNDGDVRQTLRWDYRGWHCSTPGNNFCIGVEMCESDAIRYLKPGEPGYKPAKFEVLDLAKAKRHAATTYASAVALFAFLCELTGADPASDILSHNEGGKQGIASGHVDPEHYWTQLGMPYTMDGFRADVAAALEAKPANPFHDVAESDWFYEDVLWALGAGITNGTSETTFSPDQPCTRAQAVAFLHRQQEDTLRRVAEMLAKD